MAIYDRVDTLSLHNESMRNMTQAQAKLAKSQNKISSGKAINTYVELSEQGVLESTLAAEEEMTRNNKYLEVAALTRVQIQASEIAVTDIYQTLSRFREDLTLRRSVTGEAAQISAIIRANLGKIEGKLNTRDQGIYLFSGNKTDTAPVQNIVSNSNVVDGVITDNYYQGDDGDRQILITDTFSLTYNLKANDKAFQMAIASLHKALEGDLSKDSVKLAESYQLLNDALEEVVGLLASLRNNLIILDDADLTHQNSKEFLNSTLAATLATDYAKTALESSLEMTVLQASYQFYARTQTLSLSKYLG